MKKFLSLLMLISILAFAVSCGCQEDPEANPGSGNDDPYADNDNDGYSDIFDGELPIIPIN